MANALYKAYRETKIKSYAIGNSSIEVELVDGTVLYFKVGDNDFIEREREELAGVLVRGIGAWALINNSIGIKKASLVKK